MWLTLKTQTEKGWAGNQQKNHKTNKNIQPKPDRQERIKWVILSIGWPSLWFYFHLSIWTQPLLSAGTWYLHLKPKKQTNQTHQRKYSSNKSKTNKQTSPHTQNKQRKIFKNPHQIQEKRHRDYPLLHFQI